SCATGGVREIRALAEGKLSLAWVNPSVCLTMAYRGKGPFPKRLPLRTIAVFPSYDVMGFAVHESTGVTSLTQIKKERFPLKLSTRLVTQNALKKIQPCLPWRPLCGPLGLRLVTFASGAEKFIWPLGPAIRLGVPP